MKDSEYIENFLNFIREAKVAHSADIDLHKQCDEETQDILHTIEIEKVSAVNMVKIYKLLFSVRQNRRAAKDQAILYQPLIDWMERNKGAVNELEGVLGKMRKREDYVQRRQYLYRTDILRDIGIEKDVIF